MFEILAEQSSTKRAGYSYPAGEIRRPTEDAEKARLDAGTTNEGGKQWKNKRTTFIW
jgi:hypothetical protein